MVVINQPTVDSLLHFGDRAKQQVGIEHFVPDALVEALDEGILVEPATLDEQQANAALCIQPVKASAVISGP